MARARKAPAKKTAAKKPVESTLEYDAETGTFYLVKGKDRTDVGRSRRYAERLLSEANA